MLYSSLRSLLFVGALGGSLFSFAQVNAPVNGPATKLGVITAFVHATVHPSAGEVLTDATILVLDDRIVAVGERVTVPAGAVQYDLKGLHVWPGLVEPYSDFGMPKAERGKEENPLGARFWNPAIRPSTRADQLYIYDEDKAASLRAQGFTTVIAHRMDGVARGTSCTVSLTGLTASEDVISPRTSAQFSFRKGTSREAYPNSLTGSIALLRQTFYDARWYSAAGKLEQSDADLQALNDQLNLPLVFEASNRNDVLRISSIAREFGFRCIVKGSGDEYARLADILADDRPLILPIALPEAYDVEDPFEALEVSLAKLKHWELAPTNAPRIAEAGGRFAFTTQGLKDVGSMWASLRRMIKCGLDSSVAIAALTTVPAQLYGMQDLVGAIRPGMLANLVICSHHLLSPKNVVHETWVAGKRFVQNAIPGEDPRGTFDLNLRSSILKLKVSGESQRPEADVALPGNDSAHVKASFKMERGAVTLVFEGEKIGFKGLVRLNGVVHDRGAIWDGQGQLPGGEWIAWSAVRQSAYVSKEKKEKKTDALDSLWSTPTGNVWYPLGAYGLPMLPDTEAIVFRNATVWTNGALGILPKADVCISGGRIIGVGERLNVDGLFSGKRKPSFLEIDATGKHLTCGIIDEHSHIAIERGVNEGSQSITAEVRMGDVVDPDDVDLYRNLSGGVVAIQQLHGSANAIGGQSSLIKLRWGQSADQMHIAGSSGFIKFALGENVKQSNWGDRGSRFPQTRMGVEQLMYDAFYRAKEYKLEWNAFNASAPKPGRKNAKTTKGPVLSDAREGSRPRRDLELDALAEILDRTRFITCHSYVQSEVAMLMEVADSMGFKIQTFTHILEGYKVTAKMKAHGVNASTFSDWWAYKMEVADAIPYNAALLQEQGVNVCVNSDDAEMSRRLNQEAAKAMKYGGVSPESAWKMVTLNAAKALRLDSHMGSVEVGKDADIVLWNADPMGIDAKAELTFVDGVRRFDRRADAELRNTVRAERERIIAKMIAAKKAGAPARKQERKEKGHWQCETIGEEP
ncbi:MAG: amidohydrolase family protein [Flavobacteriales bacterium]|nr:amidohydrolase family protein [Flavobacteriales bacterium]